MIILLWPLSINMKRDIFEEIVEGTGAKRREKVESLKFLELQEFIYVQLPIHPIP